VDLARVCGEEKKKDRRCYPPEALIGLNRTAILLCSFSSHPTEQSHPLEVKRPENAAKCTLNYLSSLLFNDERKYNNVNVRDFLYVQKIADFEVDQQTFTFNLPDLAAIYANIPLLRNP
jgi:hypothetical protein